MRHEMFLSMKHVVFSVFASLLLLCNLNSAIASDKEKDAPLNISGTTKVFADDIFNLLETKPELVIVDARIRSDRTQGYLEGSLSLPDVDTNCDSLRNVIPSKTTPVLFYCNGVKCGRSGNSSKVAVQCGYENIYWFRGGFEEWKSKNLPYIKK